MGANQSVENFEVPSSEHTATLHYFGGRGLADQIRWMLAASNVDFCQKTVSSREKFLEMAGCQLPFGQLPLLQIDGVEIVQSQAAVRYLARRSHLAGTSSQEALKCDMIAEAIRDVLSLVVGAPFRKYGKVADAPPSSVSTTLTTAGGVGAAKNNENIINKEAWAAHLTVIKEKWSFMGKRMEAILRNNLPATHPAVIMTRPTQAGSQAATAVVPGSVINPDQDTPVHMVGSSLTYADVLMAHLVTWLVEECGPEIVAHTPLLVILQIQVISMPSMKRFIRSDNYFPIGDKAYVEQVNTVLGRVC
mmetsp:Transcript_2845/g.5992  ORF Transcript_2845/g.5992 Transcript_2845/m.5992 type:complete len:305 (-) Transcript_2845:94-1008(-)